MFYILKKKSTKNSLKWIERSQIERKRHTIKHAGVKKKSIHLAGIFISRILNVI